MGFFNFKKRTIQTFFILLTITVLFYVLRMFTTSWGSGPNKSFLSILAEIGLYVFALPIFLLWNLSWTFAGIIWYIVEAFYLYLLACLINFLVSIIKKEKKK